MTYTNKKLLLATIILIISIFTFVPNPIFGSTGFYNIITKSIYCSKPESCIHEVAHKIDDMNGYPSRKWMFSLAVRMYLNDELKSVSASKIALDIFKFQFQHHDKKNYFNIKYPMSELYAEIFEMAKGRKENMPEDLQTFYDWDLADQLLRDLE